MKLATLILSIAILTSPCLAEEALREINWSDPNLRGKLTIGEIVGPNAECPFTQLRIRNSQSEKKIFPILTITDPCITAANYAITGQVKCENVKEMGYLEMWNYFPDGKMYPSRTIDDSNPMQSLSGSSDWRPFTLPFYHIGDATKMRPIKLEFNLVMFGRGMVCLGPVKLVQFEKSQSAESAGSSGVNAWWTDRAAGWVGGISGTVVGIFGAVIGILAGIGVARKICLSLLVLIFVFGILSLTMAVIALVYAQPYAVYYPPLLMGLLCTALSPVLFFVIKRGYEQRELRKMHAMDVR